MYVRWADANTDPETAGGWFMRHLTWPAWRFDEGESVESVFAADLKAILLVIFAALFLVLLPGSQLAPIRGGISQLLVGWAAYMLAAAFAALAAAFVLADPSVLNAFLQAADGATYGLSVGWIVGAAAPGGYRGGPAR